jgi:gluconate 5-dehydrogenase
MQKRTAYSASKAALLMLTKSLALEWCGKNFTVNSISPGPFLTEINLPVLKNQKEYKKMCQKIPLNRFGNIDEIITPMLFLASPNSSYVNGSEIIVDGGWGIL